MIYYVDNFVDKLEQIPIFLFDSLVKISHFQSRNKQFYKSVVVDNLFCFCVQEIGFTSHNGFFVANLEVTNVVERYGKSSLGYVSGNYPG